MQGIKGVYNISINLQEKIKASKKGRSSELGDEGGWTEFKAECGSMQQDVKSARIEIVGLHRGEGFGVKNLYLLSCIDDSQSCFFCFDFIFFIYFFNNSFFKCNLVKKKPFI